MSDETRAGTEGTGMDPREVATQDAKILALEYFKTLRDDMRSRETTRWISEAGKLTVAALLLGVAFAFASASWLFIAIPFLALLFDMVSYERVIGNLVRARYIREQLEDTVFSAAMRKSTLIFTPWETYQAGQTGQTGLCSRTGCRTSAVWQKGIHCLPHVIPTLLLAIVGVVAVDDRGHAVLPLLAPVLSVVLFEAVWSLRIPNTGTAAAAAPAKKASPRRRSTTRAATAATTGARSRSKTKPSTPPSA